MDTSRIRNFSIIAHIDHGKSTLADRFLQLTGAVSEREMAEQFLDRLELERERGITIKAQTVRLTYRAADGETYLLNLIDTPGHVDFTYEVSRSLAACEGALLVIDATQGVQAQTLANVYLALEHDLEILPVINKIDMAAADPDRVRQQIEEVIGLDASEAVLASAKEGIGIREILEQVVAKVPPPAGDPAAPLKAMVFDSWFDPYVGAVALVRVLEGRVAPGDEVLFMATGRRAEVDEVGVFSPNPTPLAGLGPGEVGYLTAGIKEVREVRVGDTVTHAKRPTPEPFPGFRKAQPMVFAGLYPLDAADYEELRDALEKLALNDAAFTWEPESSLALGFGFRCGFLGLLHLEIIQGRLEREFGIGLLATAPTVVYRVELTDGTTVSVDNPVDLPEPQHIAAIHEPIIDATILVPRDLVGGVMALCQERRGVQKQMDYLPGDRVMLRYELPLAEIVLDFYDRLKSVSRGYASMDYELADYRPADLVKLDILLNKQPVDALSCIVHRDQAYARGRALAEKLKELIPRQQFDVAIQAAVGSRVIARETVKALRKNVTAKCYGGDITRKRKLLEKQKAGKKRMKQVGNVEVPQSAFLAVLRLGE
ncbi:MAG: elongation factor 4 [Nitrospirae bacterium]|nr:MAG: elongation factor 4 [Nitrospirota bacterium]